MVGGDTRERRCLSGGRDAIELGLEGVYPTVDDGLLGLELLDLRREDRSAVSFSVRRHLSKSADPPILAVQSFWSCAAAETVDGSRRRGRRELGTRVAWD